MNDHELLRYSRQIILPNFGYQNQEKLANAHVLLIGVGGLGSPAALYLASSGIGELSLVDFDQVELSNLPRQILHSEKNLNQKKIESAAKSLIEINSKLKLNLIDKKISSAQELEQLCINADIILDCSDNFATRYAVNRACVKTKSTLVTAAAVQFFGQLSSYDFSIADSPCYQCLYPDNEATQEQVLTCADNGILAPIVGTMGLLQALETIKIICGIDNNLNSKLLIFDGLDMSFRTLNISKDKHCPVCNC